MTLTNSATTSLAKSWFQHYPSDHPDESKRNHAITRQHRCECGREFAQMILSERTLATAERMGVIAVIAKQIPDFWVPVHCPPCERKDLSRQARLDAYRRDEHNADARGYDSMSRRTA